MFGKDFREDAASAQNVAAMLQIEDEVYVDLRPRERQMGPWSLRRTSWASSWMARILLLASLWRSGTCNAISQESSSAVIDPDARGPDLLRRFNGGAVEPVNARMLYEVRSGNQQHALAAFIHGVECSSVAFCSPQLNVRQRADRRPSAL
jgi:hypothetical protein